MRKVFIGFFNFFVIRKEYRMSTFDDPWSYADFFVRDLFCMNQWKGHCSIFVVYYINASFQIGEKIVYYHSFYYPCLFLSVPANQCQILLLI